jgi:hypothetical protein
MHTQGLSSAHPEVQGMCEAVCPHVQRAADPIGLYQQLREKVEQRDSSPDEIGNAFYGKRDGHRN